jgi:predicted NBD/HSP70 family sugar kinase
VLLDVLVHGARSRADLARRSGLSRASLSRLTRELSEIGLIREAKAAPATGPGRPSETIEIVADAACFLGIKLTGDALYAAVVDMTGEVVYAEGEPLVTRQIDDVVALTARTVSRLGARHPRIAALGVCLAGDVRQDPERGAVVVGSAFLGWDQDVALESLLVRATGLPVAVSNDVQALTAAHHWFGAGVGAASLAVIGVGAGIGCGIVVGDTAVSGAGGHPGKVGHLPVGRDDAVCDRGHVGCVSAFATIPAILRNAHGSGFWEVLEGARAGEDAADRACRAAAEAIGAVVATVINLIDPERIIVTGEGLPIVEMHTDVLNAAVRARLDPTARPLDVVQHPFTFTDYAWGAAVTAIHAIV